jgi:hydrogenase expression/formation protein HypC
MCLGIPMRVTAINGLAARCEAKGTEREVSLLMLDADDLQVGEYVVVQLGHATERISAERAAEAWAVYDEMLAAATPAHGPQ